MEEILKTTSVTNNFTHNSNLMSSVLIDGSNNGNNLTLNLTTTTTNGYYDWPNKCINLTNFNNNCQQQLDDNNNINNRNYINVNVNIVNGSNIMDDNDDDWHEKSQNNYWALLALILVFGTAAGNILVCLAIGWERRLQNVTNYFLMSLAITDLMVAILVMPLGILTLFVGYFPLHSEHCLVWICLDVLFCTASIMHLCTISVDRYLSLRYPMRFGRNKTRRRVTLKIVFVWLLSIAMSLPLSLMYSKNHASVLVNGTCQIPDPVYKLVGSIVCFYIPLGVMLLTYCLTVRLLARQQQNLGGTNPPTGGWASGWLGQTPGLERRCTWRRLLKTSHSSTPNHGHSAASTDTELSNLDTHELWLPDSSIPEPTPSTMTALHQFGAEMLKLSRGLESVSTSISNSPVPSSKSERGIEGRGSGLLTTEIGSKSLSIETQSTSETLQPNINKGNEFNNNHNNTRTATTITTTQSGKQSNQQQQKQQKFQQQHLATENYKRIHPKDQDNNEYRNLEAEELLQINNIERNNSSSFSSTHQKLMNFKKRRRASTSSPGKKYESPGTPPPFYRKRFFSLPKNALQSIAKHSTNTYIVNKYNSDGSIDIDNDDEDTYNNYKSLIIENEHKKNIGKQSILKKSNNSSSNIRYNKQFKQQHQHQQQQQQKKQHCYDKNRHMTDNNDYLQLPPPCTCPYFGDVPIRSALKQTEVKILSSTSNNNFSPTTSISSSSSLFPITTAAAVTTTIITSKNLDEEILNNMTNQTNICTQSSSSSLSSSVLAPSIAMVVASIANTSSIPTTITPTTTTTTTTTTINLQHNNSDILNLTANSNTSIINSSMKKSSPNTSFLSLPPPTPVRKLSYSKTASVVTWDSQRNKRRGSSFGGARTTLLLTPTKVPLSASTSSHHHHHHYNNHHQQQQQQQQSQQHYFHHHHHQHHHHHHHQLQQSISTLRRSATLRNHNNINYLNSNSLVGGSAGSVNNTTNSINGHCTDSMPSSTSPLKSNKISSSPCLLQRNATVRSHHSRNSSVISRNSSRHGRIIRLEQKATKVLGVVFFTFVILWAPFFVLNLLPTVCGDCEEKISHWVFDIVTWLGYASSMVNPIFYTIFNKVFRQAFKKVLLCQYSRAATQGSAAGFNHWRPKR